MPSGAVYSRPPTLVKKELAFPLHLFSMSPNPNQQETLVSKVGKDNKNHLRERERERNSVLPFSCIQRNDAWRGKTQNFKAKFKCWLSSRQADYKSLWLIFSVSNIELFDLIGVTRKVMGTAWIFMCKMIGPFHKLPPGLLIFSFPWLFRHIAPLQAIV